MASKLILDYDPAKAKTGFNELIEVLERAGVKFERVGSKAQKMDKSIGKASAGAKEMAKSSNRASQAIGQLSFAADDFITVMTMPGMGLIPALRSASNNLSVVMASINPLLAIVPALGVALVAVVDKFINTSDAIEDVGKAAELSTKSVEEFIGRINALRGERDRLVLGPDIASRKMRRSMFDDFIKDIQKKRIEATGELRKATDEIRELEKEIIPDRPVKTTKRGLKVGGLSDFEKAANAAIQAQLLPLRTLAKQTRIEITRLEKLELERRKIFDEMLDVQAQKDVDKALVDIGSTVKESLVGQFKAADEEMDDLSKTITETARMSLDLHSKHMKQLRERRDAEEKLAELRKGWAKEEEKRHKLEIRNLQEIIKGVGQHRKAHEDAERGERSRQQQARGAASPFSMGMMGRQVAMARGIRIGGITTGTGLDRPITQQAGGGGIGQLLQGLMGQAAAGQARPNLLGQLFQAMPRGAAIRAVAGQPGPFQMVGGMGQRAARQAIAQGKVGPDAMLQAIQGFIQNNAKQLGLDAKQADFAKKVVEALADQQKQIGQNQKEMEAVIKALKAMMGGGMRGRVVRGAKRLPAGGGGFGAGIIP